MARGVPVFLLLMPDEYEDALTDMIKAFRSVAAKVRDRLLFAYGFKDTEPWPQFAQSLQARVPVRAQEEGGRAHLGLHVLKGDEGSEKRGVAGGEDHVKSHYV